MQVDTLSANDTLRNKVFKTGKIVGKVRLEVSLSNWDITPQTVRKDQLEEIVKFGKKVGFFLRQANFSPLPFLFHFSGLLR